MMLLYAGKSYKLAYERYKKQADADTSGRYFRTLFTNYNTEAAREAYLEAADLFVLQGNKASAIFTLGRLKERSPSTAQAITADGMLKKLNEPAEKPVEPKPTPVTLTKISHSSADNSTQVVIELSGQTRTEEAYLKAEPEHGLSDRFVIYMHNTKVADGVPEKFDIKSNLLSKISRNEEKPDIISLTLETGAENIIVTKANNKIIIDIRLGPQPITAYTIVIDAGHGGEDPGTVHHGLKEKDLVLDIARELARLIKERHKDINVILTRDSDVLIPLRERPNIANTNKADLFVSIHINASARNSKAKGIETYVLNVTKDPAALKLAEVENKASAAAIAELQLILLSIMNGMKLEESLMLAGLTQQSLVAELSARDYGVKQAPFTVLMGAQMPAILVEAGFLSNKDEAALLGTAAYRKKVAEGIYKGIKAYMDKTRPQEK